MSLIERIFGSRTRTRPPPSKLHIEVRVSGELADPKAVYTLIKAEPGIAADGIVSSDGDVNLRQIRASLDFDSRTEITFELVGSVRCHGGEHPVRFRRCARIAFRIRREGGGRPTPGQFRPFFPDRANRSRLTVDDQNDDDGHYRYCLRIKAEGCRGHGKLDPSIINR